MTAAVAVGILVTGGVYLILQRGLLRLVLGFLLLGHAANVLLVAAGGMDRRTAPLLGRADPETAADPLPQAFVLTAIVITFGITVYLLALLRAGSDDEDGSAGPDAPDHAADRAGDGADPDARNAPDRPHDPDRTGAPDRTGTPDDRRDPPPRRPEGRA